MNQKQFKKSVPILEKKVPNFSQKAPEHFRKSSGAFWDNIYPSQFMLLTVLS